MTEPKIPQDHPLFTLGKICMTPEIVDWVEHHQFSIHAYLARHERGGWGEVCEYDAAENALSLKQGFRILSAYTFTPTPEAGEGNSGNTNGIKFWIITEADRSATTLLLSSEY